MKGSKMSIVLFALFSVFFANLSAQDTKEELLEAIDVIKGKSIYCSPEKAVRVLMETNDSNYYSLAQNALAIAYMNGLGVEKNKDTAIMYFKNAAESGYLNAYHNLGMIEKNGAYDTQDFAKSLEYFEKGACKGSIMCSYDAGYMYYKGLGCSQSYQRAIEYFSKGIESNNPSCLYMLGLCYRNGYGVDCDEELAVEYLNKSSMANYRYAIEEAVRENAEIHECVISDDGETQIYIPESVPDHFAFLGNGDISGEYTGLLLTYDWSGEYLIKEEPIYMNVCKNNSSLEGAIVLREDTVDFTAKLDGEGNLIFDNTKIKLHERYSNGQVEYIVQNAALSLLGNTLSGRIALYSVRYKEPQRPMYVSFNKVDNTVFDDKLINSLTARPASNGSVDVYFLLPKDVNMASVNIVAQNGLNARTYSLRNLKAGVNHFKFNSNLNHGTYGVSLIADDMKGQTIIMLK